MPYFTPYKRMSASPLTIVAFKYHSSVRPQTTSLFLTILIPYQVQALRSTSFNPLTQSTLHSPSMATPLPYVTSAVWFHRTSSCTAFKCLTYNLLRTLNIRWTSAWSTSIMSTAPLVRASSDLTMPLWMIPHLALYPPPHQFHLLPSPLPPDLTMISIRSRSSPLMMSCSLTIRSRPSIVGPVVGGVVGGVVLLIVIAILLKWRSSKRSSEKSFANNSIIEPGALPIRPYAYSAVSSVPNAGFVSQGHPSSSMPFSDAPTSRPSSSHRQRPSVTPFNAHPSSSSEPTAISPPSLPSGAAEPHQFTIPNPNTDSPQLSGKMDPQLGPNTNTNPAAATNSSMTEEEANFVADLYNNNVPTAEIARLMEVMRRDRANPALPGGGSSGGPTVEEPPPRYDFTA